MKFEFTYQELLDIYTIYLKEEGNSIVLTQWPSKFKNQTAVLFKISTLFRWDHIYTEREMNDILKPIYLDYVMLRRYLIDLKLFKRDAYGKHYEKTHEVVVTIIEN
jgi:hypothetical protein